MPAAAIGACCPDHRRQHGSPAWKEGLNVVPGAEEKVVVMFYDGTERRRTGFGSLLASVVNLVGRLAGRKVVDVGDHIVR
jgi:hypothetical protein